MDLIVVYTGNGKGKTSACIGQALRALGHGLRVGFAQFMKRDGVAGEQTMLRQLESEFFQFRAGGPGFFRSEAERSRHRRQAVDLLAWCGKLDADMLILDEAIYALAYGLLYEEELTPFLDRAGSLESHLVLSGRGAPQWLAQKADIVTEMRDVRHVHASGVTSVVGIDC